MALAALEQVSSPTVTIRQIGVHPASRGQGVGRSMVEHVAAVHAAGALQAETDRDAVGFYHACVSASSPQSIDAEHGDGHGPLH